MLRSITKTQQSPIVLYCEIFHLQNVFVWLYRIYRCLFAVFFILIFWVDHLINQKNATIFCIIRKYLLFCKTFELAPAKRGHWSTYQLKSQCCPLLTPYPPHWTCTDIFVCVHLHKWNWDCYVLLVMLCDGSAHCWMQYSVINYTLRIGIQLFNAKLQLYSQFITVKLGMILKSLHKSTLEKEIIWVSPYFVQCVSYHFNIHLFLITVVLRHCCCSQ